jgi:hypothetical protein
MSVIEASVTLYIPDGDDIQSYISDIQSLITSVNGVNTRINVSEQDDPMTVSPINSFHKGKILE